MTPDQLREYWKLIHKCHSGSVPLNRSRESLPSLALGAICHPGWPGISNRLLHWIQLRCFSRALQKLPRPIAGQKVLDLGCGVGRWSRVLADLGPK